MKVREEKDAGETDGKGRQNAAQVCSNPTFSALPMRQ